MSSSRDSLLFVELLLPDAGPHADLDDGPSILRSSHKFRSHNFLCFADPKLVKDESISGIFQQIAHNDNNYSIELAIELPDLLPLKNDKSEAKFATNTNRGKADLYISNRISRFHFTHAGIAHHALLPRQKPWHGYAHVELDNQRQAVAAEEQLRSVAAMQFSIQGDTPESALESTLDNSINHLVESTNLVIRSIRHLAREQHIVARPVDRRSLLSCYLLINSPAGTRGTQVGLDGNRIARNFGSLTDDQLSELDKMLAGVISLDDVEHLLGDSRSSYAAGEFRFAFLQAVIASEIATSRTIHKVCIARGISKNRLEDNAKDMTFSWALNIGLKLALEPEKRPSDTLIASMNSARKARNRLVHESKFDLSSQTVFQFISDATEFVAALNR